MTVEKRKAIKDRCIGAIPKVLILWLSFFIIASKVGTNFVILGFFAPILYTIFSYQEFVPKKFIKSCLLLYVIALLAICATTSLFATIVINLVVTFFICYLFCTVLSQNSYTIYLIMFIFLQMRPIKMSQIPRLLVTLTVIFAVLFLILEIRQLFKNRKKVKPKVYHMAFKDISDYINQLMVEPSDMIASSNKLNQTTSMFYRKQFVNNSFPNTITNANVIDYNMVMLLDQIKLLSNIIAMDEAEKDTECLSKLHELFVDCSMIPEITDNNHILDKMKELKDKLSISSSNIEPYMSSVIQRLETILTKSVNVTKSIKRTQTGNGITAIAYIKTLGFKNYTKVNSFRIAFALRMTIVAVVTWILRHYIPGAFSYWLPLNTLLMLSPSYNDTKKNSNDRIIGNAIGCVLVFIVLHLSPYAWTPIALFLIFSLVNYCWVPRTWSSNVWTGIYGTAMVTYSIGVNTGISLKMGFLIAGYIVAILANRYLFHKPEKRVFQDNVKILGMLLQDELNLLLKKDYDKDVILSSSYLTTQLHFNENQIMAYARSHSEDDALIKDVGIVLNDISEAIKTMTLLVAKREDRHLYTEKMKVVNDSLEHVQALTEVKDMTKIVEIKEHIVEILHELKSVKA